MMTINEVFKTRDLAEASTLLTLKQKLIRLEHDGHRFWFFFSDNKDRCMKLSTMYWAGELKVDPREFSLKMRELKDRLHSQK